MLVLGAILETQRELREVLNDGVKPRDLHAEILPSGGDKKHYPIAFNALPQSMSSLTMITHTKR